MPYFRTTEQNRPGLMQFANRTPPEPPYTGKLTSQPQIIICWGTRVDKLRTLFAVEFVKFLWAVWSAKKAETYYNRMKSTVTTVSYTHLRAHETHH